MIAYLACTENTNETAMHLPWRRAVQSRKGWRASQLIFEGLYSVTAIMTVCLQPTRLSRQ